ncbi:hypothetical protein D3C72_1503390 [compost metagenome]
MSTSFYAFHVMVSIKWITHLQFPHLWDDEINEPLIMVHVLTDLNDRWQTSPIGQHARPTLIKEPTIINIRRVCAEQHKRHVVGFAYYFDNIERFVIHFFSPGINSHLHSAVTNVSGPMYSTFGIPSLLNSILSRSV